MSANLQQQTPAVKGWLSDAYKKLSDIGIPSARLDSELILSSALQQDRTYLHAHDDEVLNTDTTKIADKMLSRRLKRVPIAYITGYKEFYGRKFIVTPDTLIPRPESEDIIEILRDIFNPISHFPTPNPQLIDVGTGSGCLGITAKLEFPYLDVTLSDTSKQSLSIAAKNARSLHAKVNILKSDLMEGYTSSPGIIIANLPYVDKNWERSPETEFEPQIALFSDDNGMKITKQLLIQAAKVLNNEGVIIIESDPAQHDNLVKYAMKLGFKKTHQLGYSLAFRKTC